ncbi:MAG: hypothetical protein ACHRXM_25720 [Isosphaerales bacterium]
MGLIRPSGYRLGGSKRAGGGRERARRVAPRVPRPLEELETRVLLFGGHIDQPVHFLVTDLAPSRAVVSYVAPPPPIIQHQVVALESPSAETGPKGPFALVQVPPPSFSQGNPLSLDLGDQQVPSEASPLYSAAEGNPPAVNGQAGWPLVVTLGSNSAPIGNRQNTSPSGGAGFGPAAPGTTWAMPSTSGDGTDWHIIPVLRYVEVPGTLNPGRTSVTIQVPVDLTTSSLGISVRSSTASVDPGETPVIEHMQLVDPQGEPVDQYTPDSGQGQPPAQSVNVLLHNAPAGGSLLVQITTLNGALATQTGTTTVSSPDANWNVSFVLGVQRQGEDPAQQVAAPAQGQVAVGTLFFTSSSQSGLSSPSETIAPSAEATGSAGLDGQVLVTGASDSAAGGQVPESLDSFNVRVPTGPFASRSAGPLGPILATSDADLTPPVDRHERGLFQEIEGLKDDDAANRPERRSELASVDASAGLPHAQRTSEAEPTEGPVVVLTRSGGLPLKVTGLASGQRADLPALLASLPAMSDSEHQNAGLEATNLPMAESGVAVAAESPSSTGRPDFPDFVKAACGLALGVGLTSGPLFPDVLASVQARLPKWMLSFRARAKVGESPPATKHRFRRIRDWLRGSAAKRG